MDTLYIITVILSGDFDQRVQRVPYERKSWTLQGFCTKISDNAPPERLPR